MQARTFGLLGLATTGLGLALALVVATGPTAPDAPPGLAGPALLGGPPAAAAGDQADDGARAAAAPPGNAASAPPRRLVPAPPDEAAALILQAVGRPAPGRPALALIQLPDGRVKAFGVGDAVQRGVRLRAIRPGEVELERGHAVERLVATPAAATPPAGRAARRHAALLPLAPPGTADSPVAAAPAPVVLPADEAPRSSTAVDRAIDLARARATSRLQDANLSPTARP